LAAQKRQFSGTISGNFATGSRKAARYRQAENGVAGNKQTYLTPLFCRNFSYYLIQKPCCRSENRAMPL